MDLSERLKQLLEKKGHNVKDAAKRARVAYATMHGLVNGKASNPSRETLEKIASAYGVSVSWLLSGQEDGEASSELVARVASEDPQAFIEILLREARAAEKRAEAAATWARWLEKEADASDRVRRQVLRPAPFTVDMPPEQLQTLLEKGRVEGVTLQIPKAPRTDQGADERDQGAA